MAGSPSRVSYFSKYKILLCPENIRSSDPMALSLTQTDLALA